MKKLITTFLLSLSLFGANAFADSLPNKTTYTMATVGCVALGSIAGAGALDHKENPIPAATLGCVAGGIVVGGASITLQYLNSASDQNELAAEDRNSED